jgi:hypothetical protein
MVGGRLEWGKVRSMKHRNVGRLEYWNLGGPGFDPLFQYSNTPVIRHRAGLDATGSWLPTVQPGVDS